MKGARGVLINITGSLDMTLFEVDEAANRIRSEVDPDAFIIFGSTFDDTLEGKIRVSVVATGMDAAASAAKPVPATAKTGGVVRSLSEARQQVKQGRAKASPAEAAAWRDQAASPCRGASARGRAWAGRPDVPARAGLLRATDAAAAGAGACLHSAGAGVAGSTVETRAGRPAAGGKTADASVDGEPQRGMANLFARHRRRTGSPGKPERAETDDDRPQPRVGSASPRSGCRRRRRRTTFSTFRRSCAARPTDSGRAMPRAVAAPAGHASAFPIRPDGLRAAATRAIVRRCTARRVRAADDQSMFGDRRTGTRCSTALAGELLARRCCGTGRRSTSSGRSTSFTTRR